MAKALRAAIRFFVYELAILGVIYYGLVILKVLTPDFNYGILALILVVVFLGQWYFFYRKQISK